MSFQMDGNGTLQQQQLQLQALETFFMEVVDVRAADNSLRNDITTRDINTVTPELQLKVVQDAAGVASIAAEASVIVFDRVLFVAGNRQRVIGFRTN